MNTPFDEWLRQLAVAGKGPVSLPAAVRGEDWTTPIQLEGDWTGAVLTGSIRQAPDADTVISDFGVTGPFVEDGLTTFHIGLSGAQTAAQPTDGDGDGVVQLPFALRFTPSGGTEEMLFGGVYTLLGAV